MTKKKKLAKINKGVLEIIEASSFNAFNGPKVSHVLRENQHLWDAVWWDMSGAEDPFLKVLDPGRGDTLYIRAKTPRTFEKLEKLDALLGSLEPSKIARREVGGRCVLAAWWD